VLIINIFHKNNPKIDVANTMYRAYHHRAHTYGTTFLRKNSLIFAQKCRFGSLYSLLGIRQVKNKIFF